MVITRLEKIERYFLENPVVEEIIFVRGKNVQSCPQPKYEFHPGPLFTLLS